MWPVTLEICVIAHHLHLYVNFKIAAPPCRQLELTATCGKAKVKQWRVNFICIQFCTPSTRLALSSHSNIALNWTRSSCVEFACFLRGCVGFLQVIWPHSPKLDCDWLQPPHDLSNDKWLQMDGWLNCRWTQHLSGDSLWLFAVQG